VGFIDAVNFVRHGLVRFIDGIKRPHCNACH
jgi:hypothetical protein